jgi:glycosyltransferase involved in cell wall biosynthesis
MKKKILFVADWPETSPNVRALQALLDKDHSEEHEWTVWSCKKKPDNRTSYRWYSYFKGAFYIIRNRKKYHAIFIYQQMIGFILFEIMNLFNLKIQNIVLYTFIYNTPTFHKYLNHMVYNALKHSKGIIWDSARMAQDVKKQFPEFTEKNHSTMNPILEVLDLTTPVDPVLDDLKFRNGIYTAGKSDRDFDVVIRAFRDTDVPVTIVCPDGYKITEKNITSNIRILPFSRVNPQQYYALAGQAFCILISVTSEKSACGQLLVNFAMENEKPIIATDSYGVKDYIEDGENGVLFKIGQADQIRKGYEKLKNDKKFREKIIRNAKITAKEMSPGPFIEKIIKVIESGELKAKEKEIAVREN